MIDPFSHFYYFWRDFYLEREGRRRYYGDKRFAAIDHFLRKTYCFLNPYRISKQFLKKIGEKEICPYGETPLKTFEILGKEANIQPSDTVLELGCGRGRGAFFLSCFFGCRVIGIERIPLFVRLATLVAKDLQIEKVQFYLADMLHVKFPPVQVIYLYGTCLRENEIKSFISKCRTLPVGTKILTISYALTDYSDEKVFQLKKSFGVTFPWGKTSAYLQIKTSNLEEK